MVFHCSEMAGWVCMSFLFYPPPPTHTTHTQALGLSSSLSVLVSEKLHIRNLIKYAHIFVQRVNRKKPNQSFVLLEYVIWKNFSFSTQPSPQRATHTAARLPPDRPSLLTALHISSFSLTSVVVYRQRASVHVDDEKKHTFKHTTHNMEK